MDDLFTPVAGIRQSHDANERVNPGWAVDALEALRRFAAADPGSFTIEQARGVLEPELGKPKDGRAWGWVTAKAVKAQIIKPTTRFAATASSNGSPKRVYVRGIGSLESVS